MIRMDRANVLRAEYIQKKFGLNREIKNLNNRQAQKRFQTPHVDRQEVFQRDGRTGHHDPEYYQNLIMSNRNLTPQPFESKVYATDDDNIKTETNSPRKKKI